MNGPDLLITAVFIIAGCVIGYYWGVSDGRKQMLAERIEDVLAQGRRRDALAGNGRKCTVCDGDLRFERGQWWHVTPRGRRHAPVPDFIVGPEQPTA